MASKKMKEAAMFIEAIKAELSRRKWTPANLASAVEAKFQFGRDSVFRFLAGKTDARSDTLQAMCDVLELELVPMEVVNAA